MLVFRIAKRATIDDLRGTGSKLYGGRWNHRGAAVLYTSESRSLATVEYLVHVPAAYAPDDLAMATLEIPDDIVPEEVPTAVLPENWRRFPAPAPLADLGTAWALSRRSLLLRVPSAVVAREFNILISPDHPAMPRVVFRQIEAYAFDDRLLR
jgi:RES domain-containing protein